ncbi:haloacid dehalogenase [Aphanothece hegewaldii CCALA 016]|uniref:Haloacid dehalogenase n=1 Tax=Aphanothece hegewaldii CCALA 016 TaxID=2107694 RepID=A0A2T1M3Y5_9CHRO|nr:HAD family hydrolase [Aphanothece hegewaldii]PSF39526.1 haloacid dehalogenase [Aphanothece hegewaldii CCALA 016]
MIRLITDFDGPIMDVSERYYQVYRLCLEQTKRPDQEIKELKKAEFWKLKRHRVPESKIGLLSGLDDIQADAFSMMRKKTVHQVPYLVYDRPVPKAIETLEYIQKLGFDLAVMTMRRVRELDAAFNQYDLARFFAPNRRYCLSNDYLKTADTKDKPLLMERALKELPPASDVWMVGDTEADIIAAKTHNIKVIGVLSGIRDQSQLELYKPDFIVNNLREAVDLIVTDLPMTG